MRLLAFFSSQRINDFLFSLIHYAEAQIKCVRSSTLVMKGEGEVTEHDVHWKIQRKKRPREKENINLTDHVTQET